MRTRLRSFRSSRSVSVQGQPNQCVPIPDSNGEKYCCDTQMNCHVSYPYSPPAAGGMTRSSTGTLAMVSETDPSPAWMDPPSYMDAGSMMSGVSGGMMSGVSGVIPPWHPDMPHGRDGHHRRMPMPWSSPWGY